MNVLGPFVGIILGIAGAVVGITVAVVAAVTVAVLATVGWIVGGITALLGAAFSCALWVGMIGGGVWFLRGRSRRPALGRDRYRAVPRDERSAMQILDDRYIRGEIGRDEYLERKAFIQA